MTTKPTLFAWFEANRERFPGAKSAILADVSKAYYREVHGWGVKAATPVVPEKALNAIRSAFDPLVSYSSCVNLALAFHGKVKPAPGSKDEDKAIERLRYFTGKTFAEVRTLYRSRGDCLFYAGEGHPLLVKMELTKVTKDLLDRLADPPASVAAAAAALRPALQAFFDALTDHRTKM